MQFGIHFMNFTLDTPAERVAPVLADTARVAEGLGAEWFTMMDHYFQMEQYRTAHDPMLEGYTSLGYIAGLTERMRLSLLVTGVTYRYPGLLAKIVTTLDVLSQGRAMLGIGAAWYEREHLALGVPYPPIAQRFEMLEETLRICLQMWSDDEGPFEGEHYSLAETINVPQSVQRPHPPILIGGGGEKKTLRLVAQYADACNLFGAAPDDVAHKLDVLRRHCDEVGRDYDSITKSVMGSGSADPTQDPDGFLRSMEAYAALGIQLVSLAPQGGDPVAWVGALEPLVPRLAEL